MMAHEMPTPINDERRLPGGGKVDFGNKPKPRPKDLDKTKKKFQEPSLPNGTKPVFDSKPADKEPKEPKEPKDKSGKKNQQRVKSGGVPNGKEKEKKDVYAGSSFHSSPEALNLPKPSFSNSPKLKLGTMLQQHQQLNQLTQVPNYPVTSYPSPFYPPPPPQGVPPQGVPPQGVPPQVPGPQGHPQHPHGLSPPFPMMPMPMAQGNQSGVPGTVPYAPIPGYYYPYYYPHGPPPNQVPPNQIAPNQITQNQSQNQPQNHQGLGANHLPSHTPIPTPPPGQKISFNDLLGSSK